MEDSDDYFRSYEEMDVSYNINTIFFSFKSDFNIIVDLTSNFDSGSLFNAE